MSASSGWDYPPPTPEPARTPLDNGSEPVGYNLEDTRFQQPPMHPYGYPVAPLPTGQATAGFVLSLVGFLTGWVLPVVTVPVMVVGLVLSAVALKRCREGLAGSRGLAIAGLVLGILGLVLEAVMVVFILALWAWGR